MSVLTAHKILIASAVALFMGYGVWELLRYPDPGGVGALLRGGITHLGLWPTHSHRPPRSIAA